MDRGLRVRQGGLGVVEGTKLAEGLQRNVF
jgi:hypothetical protein